VLVQQIEKLSRNTFGSIRRMTTVIFSVSAGYALEVLKRKWKNYVGFTQVRCFNLQSDRNFEHLYEPAALFSLRKHC